MTSMETRVATGSLFREVAGDQAVQRVECDSPQPTTGGSVDWTDDISVTRCRMVVGDSGTGWPKVIVGRWVVLFTGGSGWAS